MIHESVVGTVYWPEGRTYARSKPEGAWCMDTEACDWDQRANCSGSRVAEIPSRNGNSKRRATPSCRPVSIKAGIMEVKSR